MVESKSAAERAQRWAGIGFWCAGGAFLAGMTFGRSALIAEDFRNAGNEDVFETASSGAATVFWLLMVVLVAFWAVLGVRYFLVARSLWSLRIVWSVSAATGGVALVVGLIVLWFLPVAHALVIDAERSRVLLRDRYVFREESRVVPTKDVIAIEYEQYDANGESTTTAYVSVVHAAGDMQRVSKGDVEGQQAIASRLVLSLGATLRCVRHPGDPTDDDEVIAHCQFRD